MAEPIKMPFGGADSSESKEPCIKWGPDLAIGSGTFERGLVPLCWPNGA